MSVCICQPVLAYIFVYKWQVSVCIFIMSVYSYIVFASTTASARTLKHANFPYKLELAKPYPATYQLASNIRLKKYKNNGKAHINLPKSQPMLWSVPGWLRRSCQRICVNLQTSVVWFVLISAATAVFHSALQKQNTHT